VYLQKIRTDGSLLWPQGPKLIYEGNISVYSRAMISDGDGGMYLYHCINNTGYLYGQHYDYSGVQRWGRIPRVLHWFSDRHAQIMQAVPDGEGGAMLNLRTYVFSTYAWSNQLIRIDAGGAIVGNVPVFPTQVFPSSTFNIMSGPDGSCLVYKVLFWDLVLILNKIDFSGVPLMTQAQIFTLEDVRDDQIKLQNTPEGNLLVAWADTQSACRMQLLNDNFDPLWAGGGLVFPGAAAFSTSFNPMVDVSSGIWMSWKEGDLYQGRFRAQYVNAQGEITWPGGIALAGSSWDSGRLALIPEDGAARFYWDSRSGFQTGLYCQRLSLDGEAEYPPGGQRLVEAVHVPAKNVGLAAVGRNFLAFWEETHSSRQQLIYQLFDQSSHPIFEPSGRKLNPELAQDDRNLKIKDSDGEKVALLFNALTDMGNLCYLQELDGDGNKLFPGLGIPVADAEACFDYYSGDFYIGWISGDTQQYLMGQRIRNGQKLWEDAGKILATFPPGAVAYIEAVAGPYFMYRFDAPQGGIIALRVDEDGELLPGWNPLGTPLQRINYDHSSQVLHAGLVQDNLFCFYLLSRSSYLYQFKAQMVDPQGQTPWGTYGKFIMPYSHDHQILDVHFGDSAMAMICFQYGPRILQIDVDGNTPLGPVGIAITTTERENQGGKILRQPNGYYDVFWADRYLVAASGVFHNKLRPDGTPMSLEPELLFSSYFDKFNVSAALINNYGLLTCNDNRIGEYYYGMGYGYYTSVWAVPISSLWVDTDDPLQVPVAPLVVEQNYPNPFNPSTTISFSLAKAASASLKIYNAKGQLVKTLLAPGSLAAGKHSFVWDGLDDQGSPVATGLYLYRVNADEQSLTRKMMMIK